MSKLKNTMANKSLVILGSVLIFGAIGYFLDKKLITAKTGEKSSSFMWLGVVAGILSFSLMKSLVIEKTPEKV
jgi:hypothetical protein